MNRRITATIYGRVQGVNLRSMIKVSALSMGLMGWVRNEPNGTVQLVIEGDEARLHQFMRWLNSRPSGATIESIDDHWTDATGEFHHFLIQ